MPFSMSIGHDMSTVTGRRAVVLLQQLYATTSPSPMLVGVNCSAVSVLRFQFKNARFPMVFSPKPRLVLKG